MQSVQVRSRSAMTMIGTGHVGNTPASIYGHVPTAATQTTTTRRSIELLEAKRRRQQAAGGRSNELPAKDAGWAKFRSKCNAGLFDAIEADMKKAEEQVEKDMMEDDAMIQIRAFWKRHRPNGWVPLRLRRRNFEWEEILKQKALAELREKERLEAERLEAEQVAKYASMGAEIAASVVENALALASLMRAQEAKRAAEIDEAERLEALRLEQERWALKMEEARQWEETRQEALRIEAERLAWERAEAARLAAEQLVAEKLEAEKQRRKKVADVLLQVKHKSPWLSGQVTAPYSPNVVPWQAFRGKRTPSLEPTQDHKISAEAAVVGAFVDAVAIRPKTPVSPHTYARPPPIQPSLMENASEAGGRQRSFSGPPLPSAAVPPQALMATFRPTRSEENLPAVRTPTRMIRPSSSFAYSTAHLMNKQPVKGAVPFRSPGVLAPVQQQQQQQHRPCSPGRQKGKSESVAYLAVAMAGGPSQLLPVVEVEDLRWVLQAAGIDLKHWGERKTHRLFAELSALEAALFSQSKAVGGRVQPEGTWVAGERIADQPRLSSVTPLCPHLLLKRKVLTVHLISECGRLELLQRLPSETSPAVADGDGGALPFVLKRLRVRLTDRASSSRVSIAMAAELFGIDETHVTDLDAHPLVIQRPPESCSYPGLQCEETHYIHRLHVEGLPRHSFRNHSGDWGWIKREYIGKHDHLGKRPGSSARPMTGSSSRRLKVSSRPTTARGAEMLRAASLPNLSGTPGISHMLKW